MLDFTFLVGVNSFGFRYIVLSVSITAMTEVLCNYGNCA